LCPAFFQIIFLGYPLDSSSPNIWYISVWGNCPNFILEIDGRFSSEEACQNISRNSVAQWFQMSTLSAYNQLETIQKSVYCINCGYETSPNSGIILQAIRQALSIAPVFDHEIRGGKPLDRDTRYCMYLSQADTPFIFLVLSINTQGLLQSLSNCQGAMVTYSCPDPRLIAEPKTFHIQISAFWA